MNSILRSILRINKLLVREKTPDSLLQRTVDIFGESGVYEYVCLALFNDNHDLLKWYTTEEDSGQCPFQTLRSTEQNPPCRKNAFESSNVRVLEPEEVAREFVGCPIASGQAATKVIQCAFDVPRGVGILSVGLNASNWDLDNDVRDLVGTVADDLAFALKHIRDEEKRADAEQERKKALVDAEEAKERYERLFENAGDAILIHDAEGQFLRVNHVACDMLQYSRSQLEQLNVRDIEPGYDGVAGKEMEEDTDVGRGCIVERDYVTRNGQHIPVEINRRCIQYDDQTSIISTVRDITERQKARRQKDRLLEAVKAAQEAIVVTDENGAVIFANQAARDLFGYSEVDLQQSERKNIVELFEQHVGRPDNILQRIRVGNGWEGEMQTTNSEGHEFTCYATVTALLDEQGDVLNYIATANDISEHKQTERDLRQALEDLRRTERQVIEQERQRALSQMASGIAHDFNNALSTIRGFTELLLNNQDKRRDEEVLNNYLNVIDTAASNAAETVRRMRKFYRPAEETRMRPLDINALIDEAIGLTRPKWQQEAQANGKSIKIKRNLESVPPVRGNEAELHEMLANIIFNAVDAIETEGCITVHTWCEKTDVVVEVSDDGLGMESYTCRHCVDPFYTTKGEDGTGLGLAVTSGIIRRHNGELEIDSEIGVGSQLRISLPAEEDVSGINAVEEPQMQYESDAELKVLVAEDDPAQRELLGDMLDVLGHVSVIVGDGKQAMGEFNSGQYDILVTDRAMPGMPGDELAQEVRRTQQNLPIVMVTGFGDMMEAAAEHPEHVDVLISKPISLQKLSSAIKEAQEAHKCAHNRGER